MLSLIVGIIQKCDFKFLVGGRDMLNVETVRSNSLARDKDWIMKFLKELLVVFDHHFHSLLVKMSWKLVTVNSFSGCSFGSF